MKQKNMDNRVNDMRMKQAAEAFGEILGNLFGDAVQVEMVKLDAEDTSQEKPEADSCAAETENKAPSFEGDGEEVFAEMMGDLISLADMVGHLEKIVKAQAYGKMCPVYAISVADQTLEEVSSITEKWMKYSEPEA